MADQRKVSAAIVVESEGRSYVFKVHGYSRLKELFKNGECVASPPVSVEGHNWVLRYYPNGRSVDYAGYISLVLDPVDGGKDVNMEASSIGVLGKDGLRETPYLGNMSKSSFLSDPGYFRELIFASCRLFPYLALLIKHERLEQSGNIIDDCLSIRCDLTLKKDIHSEETVGNQFVVVPPTDLRRHFCKLLESMDGADVTFHVGGEMFSAHRTVLAARSSIFRAELLGTMKEKAGSPIDIQDMEADVFKCLLHFIYTNSLPVLDVVMAGHLLVAADRYNIGRLKLICEHKLCSHIDASMVATSLAIAEQHSCNRLKEACLQFLASPSNLEAMMASDGYEHLKSSCPSVLKEFIARLLPVEWKAAKEIVMTILSICPIPHLTSTSQSSSSPWSGHLRGVPAVDPRRSGLAPTLDPGPGSRGRAPTHDLSCYKAHPTLATEPTSGMADQCKVSATVVAGSEERSYVFDFKVQGYSRAKELFKNGEYVASPPCIVGGQHLVLWYYPNGCFAGHPDYVLPILDSADAKDVKVKARLSILDKDGLPAPPHVGCFNEKIFPKEGRRFDLIISQAILEQSGHIVDDCLSIRCYLTLIKDMCGEEVMGNQFVVVPPSDLHRHFGNLPERMDGADVTFHVGGNKFLAHRLVLAASSPVFNAELLGAMKENTGSPIEIHEMEADVFQCLLDFIYTDSLPALEIASNEGGAGQDVVMAGHLLVAADRYNVERLKLMCEHKLCSHIDANMVATSLVLAEQHSCNGLKEACLQFLASPSNLEAMMASDGYEHLKSSCPSALKELLARLLPVEMKAAKEIVMTI